MRMSVCGGAIQRVALRRSVVTLLTDHCLADSCRQSLWVDLKNNAVLDRQPRHLTHASQVG